MTSRQISPDAFLWLLSAVCALHRKPFDPILIQAQFPAPHERETWVRAADELGFEVQSRRIKATRLHRENFPLVVWPGLEGQPSEESAEPGLLLDADEDAVLLLKAGTSEPQRLMLPEFAAQYERHVFLIRPKPQGVNDPDQEAVQSARRFGFSWFIPELLRHKRLWQEILLASLVIQLIALGMPLFTQVVIDKVVVHQTKSTLWVITVGMAVFILFSAILSWLRQYLVLHTGNRVDAVLGASVFERLFKLPLRYFEHRPTGVISARLQGVETIREFIASACVSLILDLPFLLIFVGIMFYYSVSLTLIVLAVLCLIVALSALMAPVFQARLREQFMIGARNQAFVTEHIVGVETVKSLQMEPQLNARYRGYLASALKAGFATRQLANTYQSSAGFLEQALSLMVLSVGAYTVMNNTDFTIGMLVAFQMFASRLSSPMLRLVGLWQEFQQASVSVARLGDVMNAPTEPYSIVPARENRRGATIRIEALSFAYESDLPPVYQNLYLDIAAGQTIGILGPSGCGKSTLAKLLQGFYQPGSGRILIDGMDIRHFSANELRSHLGVVPQETMLFSGTLYENLTAANPNVNFDQVVAACKMAEIHGVIESLPRGYQTEIGERGAGLSGGQKQRIAIARALLKRPGILIFDEATSALDTAVAEQFARTINALKGKVTMVFITHAIPRGLQLDAAFRLGPHGAQQLTTPPATPRADTGQAS